MLNRRHVTFGVFATAVSARTGSVFAETIGYQVIGVTEPITQPSSMTCWATAATILYAWKNAMSTEIEAALEQVGQKYVAKFKNNEGLAAGEKPAFLSAMGLHAEAPQNYTMKGWEDLLRKHGPLWVTTAEGQGFSIHARVLTGIAGDGTGTGTNFTIVDPADGAMHKETVSVFVKKFEDLARIDLGAGGELRPQVVHY